MLRCVTAWSGQGGSMPCRLFLPKPRSNAFSRSTMALLTISRTAEPPGDWLPYANAHGTFYHLPQWAECLAEIYSLRLDYYSARSSGTLQGLLALAEVPRLLGPRRLVSLPFSYAAGPLAGDGATAEALIAAVRQ